MYLISVEPFMLLASVLACILLFLGRFRLRGMAAREGKAPATVMLATAV